ncbi:hypothetical protein ACU6RQ_13425 [Zobellella denitrificans]
MSSQEIINAIHSLVREGKSITTAAVKARVGGQVSMPQLLQLISRYKQSPDSLPPASDIPAAPVAAADLPDLLERIQALEARLARLEQLLEQKR